MEKRTITIGDKEVAMKATALTPRLYRFTFGTDMMVDIRSLYRRLNEDNIDGGIIEQVAWAMAKQADATVPPIDEWLDGFGVADIYNATGAILSVWNDDNETTAVSKNP